MMSGLMTGRRGAGICTMVRRIAAIRAFVPEWTNDERRLNARMDYVVLDIEFNGRKFASDLPMEVIEIGAVRLNADLARLDEFGALVKPVYFSKLNSFIRQKTGIAQADIDQADGFPAVATLFISWLNRSESFLLVTWGGEDLKRIVLDTRMHRMDDAFWMAAPYYDLLKGYLRYRGIANDVSVEAAMADLGLPVSGHAHRALEDARMTAELFRRLFPSLDLDRTQHYVDTYSNARERRFVKNAARIQATRKTPMDWKTLSEQVLAGKIDLADARKAAELKTYYEAELASRRTGGSKPS
jgi:inhibitor of KinA sporulation pathway (predicted exonuclease)